MCTNAEAVGVAIAGRDVLKECEARVLDGLDKVGELYHGNAVLLVVTAGGDDVLKECGGDGVLGEGKLKEKQEEEKNKEGDGLYTSAVVQASNIVNECKGLRDSRAGIRRVRRVKDDSKGAGEGSRGKLRKRLKPGGNLVSPAGADRHDVLRGCGGSGSGSLEKVEGLYTDAVKLAVHGHDVFGDSSVYLAHGDELVSVQRSGIVREEDDRGALEEGRWILAKGTCSAGIVSVPSDLELVVAKLVTGPQPGARDANAQRGDSPEVLATNPPSVLLSAKGAAQGGVTGPETPDIVQDRGRSPSADSVPSSDQQDLANFAPGELLRIVESRSPDGTTRANPVAPASKCAKPPVQVTQKVQAKAPRKRRYMPKILYDKPRRSRAKKAKTETAASDEASPPDVIFETSSPTLLQMKMLARRKKPQIKRRRYVKRQKRDEATNDSPAADKTGPNEEQKNAPRTEESTQLNPGGRRSGSSQCVDPLLQGLNPSVVVGESCCTQGDGREHLGAGPEEDCNAPEFSKSLFSDPVASFSSQIPLADQGSSSFDPLSKPSHGRDFSSEVLVEACLQISGNVMSRDELRSALDPVSSWPDGPPDLSPGDRDQCVAVDEDHPSTPRGPVSSVNPCLDFTLVLPPPSPPSPQGAVDRNGGFSHVSVASTRRSLKFDLQLNELQVVDSELSSSKDAEERSEPVVVVETKVGGITGLEIPVPEENCVPALPRNEPVDSSERRQEELQIVAYDDGSKKMVVYKKPPVRKRRVRFQPKVHLDFSTVKKFKTLMLKGIDDDDTEQDKASWEQARRQWQNRAHRFISIMRQVQGNRAFSRWKGSVVDSVGGAFLTQNVSDFLSSNAFMALRARFPARGGASKEHTGTSTPEAKDQAPSEKESLVPQPESLTPIEEESPVPQPESRTPIEEESPVPQTESLTPIEEESLVPQPENLTRVELKELRMGENRRQGEASETVVTLLSNSMDDRECTDEELTKIVETLRTKLVGFHIEHRDHEPVPSNDAVMNQSNSKLSSKSLQQGEVQVENREGELNPPGSPWKGELGVIQEKFSNIVEENISSLTVVGKEKVLAATLCLVLGKKQIPREGDKRKAWSLKTIKLRPARALMRRKIDNYRYRQGNMSYKLLSGEARATWEAGYVMKSQKDKWEPLRVNILADESYSRDPLTEDCVDWEAVLQASVHEVADVIKNRGMNHALAGRLKAFLGRVHRDQNGSIDLEWIRKLPPEDAKTFLLSIRGVGLKSVECIRLLTLHHPSFPVDTNVGRIVVRLGWVPLETLPEETQLHLLELYPIQSHIQQYMWPRLCTLDQQTLYELHYQMITFGKVFCTKSKPNCNACPLRSECKHYASSYASAKLLLKWPEKQDKQSAVFALPGSAAQTVPTPNSTIINEDPCIPIIEEPHSPEPHTHSSIPDSDIPDIEEVPFDVDCNTSGDLAETQIEPHSGFTVIIGELRSLSDIKATSMDVSDDPESDSFQLPPRNSIDQLQPKVVEYEEGAMELDINESTEVCLGDTREIIQEAMDLNVNTVVMAVKSTHEAAVEEKIEVVTDDFNHLPSQELILLPPQSSLAPAPKLKNVQRLRTVHFVYELPDNHPLLFEMDQREADDPCFYLLAIWSPDEVPETIPKINDDDADNPFASCEDSSPEQTVRGTLLIPCKTAMRGWFPLNGTYFQVNEVFADHASSIQPIDVPRTLLWSLRRRFVYFSTAVSNLFKDMSQEEIQCCFQKGYVCLRAFDVVTRQPKLLAHRLHQSGAKIVTAPAPRRGRGKGKPRMNARKDKSESIATQEPASDAPLTQTSPVAVVT